MKTFILILIIVSCYSDMVSAQAKTKVKNSTKPAVTAFAADYKLLVGTWQCDQDSLWKLVITADKKCTQYYEGKLQEHDRVILSPGKTAYCVELGTTATDLEYLELRNLDDKNRHLCYEVNNIDKHVISLRALGHGGYIMFYRQ